MPVNPHRKQQARILRYTRKLHRWTGLALFIFFFIVGVTSVLLGLKKDFDYLMPPTAKTEGKLEDFLPADRLLGLAQTALSDARGPVYSTEIDRMDYRPGKGIIKFLFRGHLQEVQLDGVTGEVLSVGARRADLIEHIHDGSVVDEYFGWRGSPFKVIYSSLMGVALLVFTVSGFWLWYGPRRLRRR